MDCTTQIQHWFYICLALIGLILFLVAMFMNYNLKLKDKNIELTKRTEALEKKNGHELEEIKKLNQKMQELEKRYERN